MSNWHLERALACVLNAVVSRFIGAPPRKGFHMPTNISLKTKAIVIFLILNACGIDQPESAKADSRILTGSRLSKDHVGVNIHRPTGEDARFLLGKVQELGAGWVRIDVSWDDIEIAKGEYKWERADEPIMEAKLRGLKILANIHATPKWANDNSGSAVVPKKVEDWQDFCSKVAGRYDGRHDGLPRIEVFGIWNEPDGEGLRDFSQQGRRSSPELYADRILKPCSKAIRAARPDAKTAGPELASESDYLQKVVSLAGDSLDIITVHKYSDEPGGVVAHMDKIRSIVENSPRTSGKPIWLTETGWSTKSTSRCWFNTVDNATQASKSKSLLNLIEKRKWIDKVFFYELRDDDAEGACQWGMLRSNGSEKTWFGELKNYLHASPQPNPDEQNPPVQVPWGSFRSTCKNEEIRSGVLYARCKDRRGNWKNARLDSYQGCRDIVNNDGNLVCSR